MKLSAPLLVSLAAFSQAVTALVAFPGAEGFGAEAIGGRKGQVYVVTNLNDSGTGSLRDAVSATDRIVVFAVGGVIKISDRIVVSKRVTILGQTAPGDGITVYGNGWSFSNADDAIVRYIRMYVYAFFGDRILGVLTDVPLVAWARVAPQARTPWASPKEIG
jgi:hypothetical protein